MSSHGQTFTTSSKLNWLGSKGSDSASSSRHGSSHGRGNMVSPDGSAHGRENVLSPNANKSLRGGLTGDKPLGIRREDSWLPHLEAHEEAQAVTVEPRHMVDMSQLFLGQKFASGTFSRLYHGQYKTREVAVKVVRQPDDDEKIAQRLERQFGQEVSLLSRLHHKNIVEFLGAMKKPPVFFIVTEYVPGGSLRAFLHKNFLPLNQVLDLASDIAQGMDYLHSQGVLHLDLKSENLVLTEQMRVKVTDFGIARLQSECFSMTPDSGTYRWMAPEMISNKFFSTKADVYGFGIILWELVTGQTPFEDLSSLQAAFAVVHKHARPHIPDTCPQPLKQLMEECWADNPDKRPHFWQIVQRLDELQEWVRRNGSLLLWQLACEKRNPIQHLLNKCKFRCIHFN